MAFYLDGVFSCSCVTFTETFNNRFLNSCLFQHPEATEQHDHPSGVVFVSPDEYIIALLLHVDFCSTDSVEFSQRQSFKITSYLINMFNMFRNLFILADWSITNEFSTAEQVCPEHQLEAESCQLLHLFWMRLIGWLAPNRWCMHCWLTACLRRGLFMKLF